MSRDDDLLERATRALRATPPPADGELARAKQRMLAAHQAATKKGGARTLRWVLPLAAVLAAGSALAATPHGYERLASALNRVVGFELLAIEAKPSAPRQPVAPKLASKPIAPAPIEPASEAREPAATEPGVAEPEPGVQLRSVERSLPKKIKRERALPSAPAAAPSSEPPAPAVEPAPQLEASADLAKYRAAHKAHFQDRDFVLALRNWDAYLRQYPSGTFALEARYNRAICLLRLERNDEARRALTPFAKGELGNGYRQAEATKLLQALE